MVLVTGIGGVFNVQPNSISQKNAPPANFKAPLGQQYFDTSTNPPTYYVFNGQTWTTPLGTILTLTTDSGIATAVANNINVVGGTAMDTSASGSTVTISWDASEVPAVPTSITTDSGTVTPALNTFAAVGGANIATSGAGSTLTIGLVASPSVAGSLTAGTTITATLGNITATNGNFVLGTTGKGISFLNTATILGSAAAVTGTAPTGVDWIYKLSDDAGVGLLAVQNSSGVQKFAVTSLGQIHNAGSITSDAGDITATNGNFVKGTAGNKDVYTSVASTTTAGANSAGTVVLAGGTATVATTAVTASSLIRLYRQGIGSTGAAALGFVTLGTITASTSFVINAVQPADATALQVSDLSVIFWEIVN